MKRKNSSSKGSDATKASSGSANKSGESFSANSGSPPIIPTCASCSQLLTSCRCKDNNLQK